MNGESVGELAIGAGAQDIEETEAPVAERASGHRAEGGEPAAIPETPRPAARAERGHDVAAPPPTSPDDIDIVAGGMGALALDDRVSVTNPAGTNSMRDDAPQAPAPTNSMGDDAPQASAGASKSEKAKDAKDFTEEEWDERFNPKRAAARGSLPAQGSRAWRSGSPCGLTRVRRDVNGGGVNGHIYSASVRTRYATSARRRR